MKSGPTTARGKAAIDFCGSRIYTKVSIFSTNPDFIFF